MTLRLYCYRDIVEKNNGTGVLGVTLYFAVEIHRRGILTAIAEHVTASKQAEVTKAIEKLFGVDNPVIEFVRMCIQTGTGKTRCYFDARAAGLAVRKQTQLALYDYLRMVETEPEEPKYRKEEILPDYGFFEEVQQHFADQFESYTGGLVYDLSMLSTCDIDDPGTTGAPIEADDFVFEVGDLESGRFRYWGHWKDDDWLQVKIFSGFDLHRLETILRRK